MKRIELASPSTIDSLRIVDRKRPRPGPGEVLVRVRASSLNFHDYLVATGVLKAAEGRVPMSDGAGEVVELGEGANRFAVGDRVIGTYYGGWIDGPATPAKLALARGDQIDGFAAEYVMVSEQTLTRVPQSLSDAEAATLPCAGVTAWHALFGDHRIKPGDSVLVQGTGGVSIFALQFARMAGASVIALTSTAEKAARLNELGAAHVVSYTEQPQWGAIVRELTGGCGVDVAVEVVGGDLSQTLSALKLGGRTVLIGALSRKPISYASFAAIVGNASVAALTVGSREHQEEMVRAIDANGLKPVIDRTFPLDQIGEAFRFQEQKRHFGKIALAW
jgi:NADPH:quinone reductase-like Zn-dependent oxidoreductase